MNTFSDERMEKVHKYFDKYGNKTVFFARFVWGLRAATFFIAGTHTMSAVRFIILDFIGALISIPTIVFIAYHFGSELEKAVKLISQTKDIFIVVTAVIILFFIIKNYIKKRKKT